MVLKAFEQIVKTGGMTLFRSHHPDYADGEQLRDFVYVKDAAAMTLHFLERTAVNGIFNIGTGTARSWNDLARALFAALGREQDITYIDMPQEIRSRYQYYTRAATAKLQGAQYRKSATSLDDSIADYVKNYLLRARHLGDDGDSP